MKIYTSYFYQVRFFPPDLIPLSTAVWDPNWFHNNHSASYQFKDKRGVWNGIRAEIFYPRVVGCNGKLCEKTPDTCKFLLDYYGQLNQLNFQETIERFERLRDKICTVEGFKDCDFALLVYEAPTNPCSERGSIQKWFAANGMPIEEWYPLS